MMMLEALGWAAVFFWFAGPLITLFICVIALIEIRGQHEIDKLKLLVELAKAGGTLRDEAGEVPYYGVNATGGMGQEEAAAEKPREAPAVNRPVLRELLQEVRPVVEPETIGRPEVSEKREEHSCGCMEL